MNTLALICLGLAMIPLAVALGNLPLFRRLPPPGVCPPVSLLIPARNEAGGIEPTLRAALASIHVQLQVIVLDDGSTDGTADIVQRLAAEDPRLALVQAPELPPGWCGKQHACHVLSRLAAHDAMLFMDADVRLAPDAIARMAGHLHRTGNSLISGFPRQVAVTLGEQLLVCLIHFLLLGFLPIAGLRWTRLPGFGAGCGQLIMVRREDYLRTGGHAAIARSRHDGIALPRTFRRHGLSTDIFDATDTAACRMYDSFPAAWHGFMKNATEGMATPAGLPVWTLLLGGGQVLPFLLLAAAAVGVLPASVMLPTGLACLGTLALRMLLARRFRQPLAGALLHPIAVAVLLAVQYAAVARASRGRAVSWRGRSYQAASPVA